MRRKDRGIEVFNLSFLDCICCGFGAMILLFVLSRFSAPQQIEAAQVDLKARIERLAEELHVIRGETVILNRELTARVEQLSEEKKRLARRQGDLAAIEGRFAAATGDAEVQNIIDGQLARARQELTEEQQRLQQVQPRRRPDGQVGGIPVDSEYVIFVIDTSNSMQRGAWPLVQQKLQEALAVYPQVKGLQVMNDDGLYMFPQYTGKWIPDTAGRRRVILNTLGSWQPFSNSSPVEGIVEAIRAFRGEGQRISLYVFGDEFSGTS
ncbi:MAG: VWA domain-containing protein, partial [Desulfobacteraceae bacterium]